MEPRVNYGHVVGRSARATGRKETPLATPPEAEPPTQASQGPWLLVRTPGGPSPGIRTLVSHSDGFGFTRRPLRRWVAGSDDAWSKQGWGGPKGGLSFAAIAIGGRVAVSFQEKGRNSDPFLPEQISTRSHNIWGPIGLECSSLLLRGSDCWILHSLLLRHPKWRVRMSTFMCNYYWPIIGRQLSLSSKSYSLLF